MRRTKPPKRPLTLAEKVVKTAKRQRTPKEDRGVWLNTAADFNIHLTLAEPEAVSDLLDVLLDGRRIYQRERWITDLATLIANLRESDRCGCPITISLNANDWHAAARYQLPRYHVVELIKRMQERGLIGWKKGTNLPGFKRRTRICVNPGEKLISGIGRMV